MYEFLETFAQIFCASLSLVVLSVIYSKSIKLKTLNIVPLNFVFFFCLFKVVFYYLVPSNLGYSIGHKFLPEEGHTLSQLTQIYVIELVSWATWGFGFLVALGSIKSKPLMLFRITSISTFNDRYAKQICISISMLSIPYRLISYTALPLPGFFEPFKSLLNYGGGTCSVLLLVLGLIRWGPACSWLGFLGTLSLLTTVGGRSAWLYCITYAIFLIISLVSNTKKRRNIVIFLTTIPIIFFVFSGGLPSLSYVPDLDGTYIFSADTSSAKRVNRST